MRRNPNAHDELTEVLSGRVIEQEFDCKEFAFASAAPETVRTGTSLGE